MRLEDVRKEFHKKLARRHITIGVAFEVTEVMVGRESLKRRRKKNSEQKILNEITGNTGDNIMPQREKFRSMILP